MLEPQPVGDCCRNSPGMPLIVYPQKPFPTAPDRCVVRFPHKYALTTRRLAKNYTPVRADNYSDRRECIRKAVCQCGRPRSRARERSIRNTASVKPLP